MQPLTCEITLCYKLKGAVKQGTLCIFSKMRWWEGKLESQHGFHTWVKDIVLADFVINLNKITLYCTINCHNYLLFNHLLLAFRGLWRFLSKTRVTIETGIFVVDFDQEKYLRQNPPGHRVILIFSGQKSCTRIINLKHIAFFLTFFKG